MPVTADDTEDHYVDRKLCLHDWEDIFSVHSHLLSCVLCDSSTSVQIDLASFWQSLPLHQNLNSATAF